MKIIKPEDRFFRHISIQLNSENIGQETFKKTLKYLHEIVPALGNQSTQKIVPQTINTNGAISELSKDTKQN